MQTTTDTISFKVEGLPPAKSEAKSMLGAGHPHASRVVALLTAGRDALVEQTGGVGFGGRTLGIEVVLTSPVQPPSDMTNYLGGIGDVLENKVARAAYTGYLGALGGVALFDNDSQLRESTYRERRSERTNYSVRLWAL